VDGLQVERDQAVVVRTYQGLELGTVLCPVSEGHFRFLSRTAQGEILRLASAADEQAAHEAQQRGQRLFEDARQLAGELGLPLEVVDAEVLLDGRQAILYYVAGETCDQRALVSRLASRFDVSMAAHNLALPKAPAEAGCGKPDCGKAGGKGGCTSCNSGGCGTCSAGTRKEDIGTYLAGLRQRMEEHAARQSLL
ncbi:MAG TPA: PSP1 domain-containing protein, partial [Gemmataceae bacterium]|nr:PSP1 domain-containing protein [Gemmataceae bacterium]